MNKPFDTTLTSISLIRSLGEFDLDPCAFPGHPTARELITLPTCGLKAKWHGRVWLNPPYSQTNKWLEKMVDHGQGTALVLASTDTAWFHDLIVPHASALLFPRGRLVFNRVDGSLVKLMRASLIVAYGELDSAALEHCGLEGFFVKLGKD